jgi:hypothetical protein
MARPCHPYRRCRCHRCLQPTCCHRHDVCRQEPGAQLRQYLYFRDVVPVSKYFCTSKASTLPCFGPEDSGGFLDASQDLVRRSFVSAFAKPIVWRQRFISMSRPADAIRHTPIHTHTHTHTRTHARTHTHTHTHTHTRTHARTHIYIYI